MKIKTTAIILMGLAWAGFARAATNDVTTLVQKGLFEEEANHHLDAAIEYYHEAVSHFDKDRQLAATAIFHLGECYRLQGNTNAANEQYQRIVREFPDQTPLVELSRGYLPKGGASGHTSFTQSLTRISGQGEAISPDEQNEIRKIKDMIQNSPDLISAPDASLLVNAAREGWISAAKLLLENGAVINPVLSEKEQSPLTAAVDHGNNGMVEFLLSKGADANASDRADVEPGNYFGGLTPLEYAVLRGFKTVAETLLAHGADVNGSLYVAASWDRLNMAGLLLAHHADVNAHDNNGLTPLLSAIVHAHFDMVQFLVSNKADVNFKNKWGVGPLDAAIADGHNDMVKLLLQEHADPNAVDNDGATPLDLAISKLGGQTNIIAELIAAHADVNQADKHGDPPLAYASRHGGDTIKNMLVAAGANEDYLRREGIFLAQKGSGSIGNKVFYKDANHYTLFDLIAKVYCPDWRQSPVFFPDLSHVTINRLKADGSKEDVAVDLNEIMQSGDCSKNLGLEWGDVVLIPQLDHRVNVSWPGLSRTEVGALGKCLMRQVKIVVKGQAMQILLLPPIVAPVDLSSIGITVSDGKPKLFSFELNTVVRQSGLLLISSDLTDVGVTRRNSGSGWQSLFLHFNLEAQPIPDFQLEDGDVINIPERK